MNNLYTAPVYKMKDLNNLFIEMTAKNCNKRCANCYIDFPMSKSIKDFISIDIIKNALSDLQNQNLQCIYFTGAEPMMHPDFNAILRLCLKKTNVCICTNGSFLNEKKIRFLKKVEEEGMMQNFCNQIFFKLTLAHYEEHENDKKRYRGNYRETVFALKTLSNYGFTTVINVLNYYNIPYDLIKKNFEILFSEANIQNVDLQISYPHPSFNEENYIKESADTDCMHGRILTGNGIYACPFLANDYRGRCGSNFKDFSRIVQAETDYCATCSKNNAQISKKCKK